MIEVLRLTMDGLGSNYQAGSLFVGLSDENLSSERFSSNCPKCDEKVQLMIQEFNGTQNIDKLLKISCKCKQEWERLVKL